MKAYMPHRFVTATNLDCERINDNLEEGARATQANLDRRYTYSHAEFPLDGVTDASATVLRQFAIRRPIAGQAVEIVSVEFVVYGAAGDTWTLACSDTTWPSIVAVTSTADTESWPSTAAAALGFSFLRGPSTSNVPVSIPSESTDVTFTVSCPTGATITAGRIIVHLRCDRGNQGTSHAGYTPTLIDSSSSTAASLLNTEITALTSAVSRDTTNDKDLRLETFAVRDLANSAALAVRMPSGARRIMRVQGYVVAAATETIEFALSGDITAILVTVAGSGVTARTTGGFTAITDVTQDDDPMDATDDLVVDISSHGGSVSILLAYINIWWS